MSSKAKNYSPLPCIGLWKPWIHVAIMMLREADVPDSSDVCLRKRQLLRRDMRIELSGSTTTIAFVSVWKLGN
jgi:hypothetical protein